jgi:hypothetical protein
VVRAHQKISATQGLLTHLSANWFGMSVASLNDTTLAVGAHGDNDGGTRRGAVYILFLSQLGNVQQQQKISQTAGNFGGTLANTDRFGVSVARVGDLDGDQVQDLAVGALGAWEGATIPGAVWILHLETDGTVKNQHKITQAVGGG